jgi:hypothetical protein
VIGFEHGEVLPAASVALAVIMAVVSSATPTPIPAAANAPAVPADSVGPEQSADE